MARSAVNASVCSSAGSDRGPWLPERCKLELECCICTMHRWYCGSGIYWAMHQCRDVAILAVSRGIQVQGNPQPRFDRSMRNCHEQAYCGVQPALPSAVDPSARLTPLNPFNPELAVPGVRPRLRSSSRFPAELRSDRLGVIAGGAILPPPPLTLPGVLDGVLPLDRSAAARSVSDKPPAPLLPPPLEPDVYLGLGVKPFARSCMARLALSPNLRAISSRRFVFGRRKDGVASSGSPLSAFPSSARGVDINVPHVSRLGRPSGSGDGSLGKRG